MKKLLFAVMLLISFSAVGQLNSSANILKNGKIHYLDEGGKIFYEAIKTYAVNKWGTDHDMILYEINIQSEAAIEFLILAVNGEADKKILASALFKWTEKPTKNPYNNPTTDWTMALYEYNRQITAKNAY